MEEQKLLETGIDALSPMNLPLARLVNISEIDYIEPADFFKNFDSWVKMVKESDIPLQRQCEIISEVIECGKDRITAYKLYLSNK